MMGTAHLPYRPRRGWTRRDGRCGTALLYEGIARRRFLVRFDDGTWQWTQASEWENAGYRQPTRTGSVDESGGEEAPAA